MKAIITLLACFLCFTATQAQTTYRGQLSGTTPDTLTNSDSEVYTLTVSGAKTNVSFQYNIDKVSGTVGGTIVCAGSIDGTNYATLNSYTITDADATASYTMSYNGYTKYKITVTTTGTQVSGYDIWYLHR